MSAEPRKSARLRAKGRRRWVDDESDEAENANSATEDLEPKEGPPSKQARVEGLDEEDEESRDVDYVESESGRDDDDESSNRRSQTGGRSTERRKAPPAKKNWDQVFEDDDENHESETSQDYPLEVTVGGENDHFIVDGYTYRRLPADRKCGLGGLYLRCYQDKGLGCGARATAIRTDEGKLMAKLSKAANQHNHERPPEGSIVVPVPNKGDSITPSQRRRSKRQEPPRRRGRPPRVIPDDDDNETDFGEEDNSKRYRLPIEVFGMNKYYVMDGYVYRRHRDRRVGYGGLYLRCYQDKELNCPARAVAVWFKSRDDIEPIGDRSKRILFGRLSTTYPNHSHPKPPKGHFWVKPGQQIVMLPPHLRRSGGSNETSNMEYADFTEPVVPESTLGEDRAESAEAEAGSKRYPLSVASKSFDDHRYTPAEALKSTSTPAPRRQSKRNASALATSSEKGRRADKSAFMEEPSDNTRFKKPIVVSVQVEDDGEHFIIDGYTFRRQGPGQSLLVCVESKREFKCCARATLLHQEASTRSGRSRGGEAQFANAGARRHTHPRPVSGHIVLPPKLTPAHPVGRPSQASKKFHPASTALTIFSRTPFLRPLSVPPRAADKAKATAVVESKSVNLKSVMSSYRYCLDALIRLQDGYYTGRFPQLNILIDAPGSELIDYYIQRSHGRLPMAAADERAAYLLNNDMKHYRAICDFMQMAPNDCERVVETYKRWLTPSRSRAWWNTGDMLEYICRILLRTDEYSEAYGSALSLCQRSTRLRHLFRPLLPFPEPKFLRCEKETIRRWEMRQALEDVNARISAVRVRETDSEAATNRLLDEFETAVASFMKFYTKSGAEESGVSDDTSFSD